MKSYGFVDLLCSVSSTTVIRSVRLRMNEINLRAKFVRD
jgi:hypothetical protein